MTDWKATPLAPFAATSQDAPGFWMQGCLWTVLASGEQTGSHPGAPAEFAASPRRDERYGHAVQNWAV
jgi:hypothetical protein